MTLTSALSSSELSLSRALCITGKVGSEPSDTVTKGYVWQVFTYSKGLNLLVMPQPGCAADL
ncbi:hypothetical protein VAWG006_01710 [Aeromonas enteropelogenes]|nr:hypothetical protein VAWG006_01710 [Aeromonas enteropelogenes]BEE20076.1 hypothetical protein VAWG007_01710 [Aeromonas enteropelogenes]